MTKRFVGQRRAAAAATEMFWLAPAVIAMRMPLLMAETLRPVSGRAESNRAVSEKAVAVAQGVFAAQMSLAMAGTRYWFGLMTGSHPSANIERAAGDAFAAALAPSRQRVKGNYRRLRAIAFGA